MDSLKQEVEAKERAFLKLVADLKSAGSATGTGLYDKTKLPRASFNWANSPAPTGSGLYDKTKLGEIMFQDVEFRKASGSNNQHWGWCVLVAEKNGAVAVRDSKDQSKTTLRFTIDEWHAFIKGVKAGEFDF